MAHHICGIVIALPYDVERARSYDLIPALEDGARTMFPIDHHWAAVWQARRGDVDGRLELPAGISARFPSAGAIHAIVEEITGRPDLQYAVILTDYFGGRGEQWAVLFEGVRRLTDSVSVNEVLRRLGVVHAAGLDEWDTFGLEHVRSSPAYLGRYRKLCLELGV